MAAFNVGDLVLATVTGHPSWPARVANPKNENAETAAWHKPKGGQRAYWVCFFGTNEFAWIRQRNMKRYTSGMKIRLTAAAKANKKLKAAFQVAEEYANRMAKKGG